MRIQESGRLSRQKNRKTIRLKTSFEGSRRRPSATRKTQNPCDLFLNGVTLPIFVLIETHSYHSQIKILVTALIMELRQVSRIVPNVYRGDTRNMARRKKTRRLLLGLIIFLLSTAILLNYAMVSARAEETNSTTTISKAPPAASSSASVAVSVRVASTIEIVDGEVKSNCPLTVAEGQGKITYIWSY